MSLADLRKAYAKAELDERTVERHPLRQFLSWLDEAVHADLPEPNAMTLATATPDGHPSARMVLLKGADDHGLVFFTDSRSRKGAELAANPHAALVFWWAELERQVRIVGLTEPIAGAQSDSYFSSRPIGSRLSAWVSHQSQVVQNRAELEARWAETANHHADGSIARPPWWGGIRVIPEEYEFWQGRPNRLHDRIRYKRAANGAWVLERLSP
jgi:pyridoxamine 5'-phosphate oxidase